MCVCRISCRTETGAGGALMYVSRVLYRMGTMLGDAVRCTEEKAVYSWNQYLWRQSSFTDAEEKSVFLE